jgi:hypothetical protein
MAFTRYDAWPHQWQCHNVDLTPSFAQVHDCLFLGNSFLRCPIFPYCVHAITSKLLSLALFSFAHLVGEASCGGGGGTCRSCLRNFCAIDSPSEQSFVFLGVRETMQVHALAISEHVAAVSNAQLLETIVQKWDRHKLIMSMIRDILMYMVCSAWFFFLNESREINSFVL